MERWRWPSRSVVASGRWAQAAYGDRERPAREPPIVTAGTERGSLPWGGFLSRGIDVEVVDHVLARQSHAVMPPFGDPSPFAVRVRVAGAALIIRITDLDEARQAPATAGGR